MQEEMGEVPFSFFSKGIRKIGTDAYLDILVECYCIRVSYTSYLNRI